MTDRVHSLIVDLVEDEFAYQYMCREGSNAPPLATYRKSIRLEEIREVADCLSQSLTELATRQNDDDAGQAELREWGGKLHDKVVPTELADKLRIEKAPSYLVLYLHPGLAWLPWELLWDGEQFLSCRFWAARFLQKTGSEIRVAEGRLRNERSGRGALIVFGDTSGLKADAEKAQIEKTLGGVYGSNIWFHRTKSATDTLEQLKKDYEICHFIGHGNYVEDDPGATGWRFADGTVLTCRDVESVSTHASFPLLIYANSCDSARQSLTDRYAYVSALYRAFLRQGVPHYIGTVARIPDASSLEFAQLFYKKLAEGLSVGEAVGKTRELFLSRPGPPIWAYYVHYGDPVYRLVSTPAARAEFATVNLQDILPLSTTVGVPELFVDREKELEDIRKHVRLLGQGKPSVLFISGEAGVGKSAFLRKLLGEVIKDVPGTVTAFGTCNRQLGVTDPYAPFKRIIHSLVHNTTPLVRPHGEAMTVGEAIVAELVSSFPQLIAVFRPDIELGSQRWEKVCQRLGLSAPQETSPVAGTDQSTIFDQFTRLLRRLGSIVPLLIAVDNLHWADDSSLGLFLHNGRTITDVPVILIGTYRPDLLQRTRGGTVHPLTHAVNELRRYGARTVSLDLSTAKASDRERIHAFTTAYLDKALPDHRLPLWFVQRLAEHSGGNALFLTELVKYAQEKGHVVLTNGKWQLAVELEHFELPESVEAIIDERIGQLSEELRETLTYASVEGEDFTAQVLASLQELNEDKVLNRLVEDLDHMHQIVDERGEHELSPDNVLSLFHFRNTFIQQHMYQELGAAQRRRLHKKVGECLEKLYGERSSDIAGQLAAHFRIAREWKKALTYAIEAARRSVKIYANREAVLSYRTALELCELIPEKDLDLKLSLLLELGDVHKHMANFEEGLRIYDQILDSSPLRATIRAYALNGIGDVLRSRGDYAKALPYYRECELLARSLNDTGLLVEVSTDLAYLFLHLAGNARQGGLEEEAITNDAQAKDYAQRVVERAAECAAWDNLRKAYICLANIASQNRDLDKAAGLYDDATLIAEKYELAKTSLHGVGEVNRLRGRLDQALRAYQAYLQWAIKTGATRSEMIAYNDIGVIGLEQGDFEQAREYFDKSLELNTPLRRRLTAIVSLAMKGLTFEMQNAPSAALDYYRHAIAMAQINDPGASTPTMKRELYRFLTAHEPNYASYLSSRSTDEERTTSGN